MLCLMAPNVQELCSTMKQGGLLGAGLGNAKQTKKVSDHIRLYIKPL